jgi:hypothetical protein
VPNSPMTRRVGRGLVVLVMIGMLVQLGVIVYVAKNGHDGRVNLIHASRAGCERSKLDRQDNADFQKAQSTYIRKVVLAQSVKPDVKQAARTARKTFKRTSASLSVRAQIDCKKAFP